MTASGLAWGAAGERFGRAEYLREYFPDAWRWAVRRRILTAI